MKKLALTLLLIGGLGVQLFAQTVSGRSNALFLDIKAESQIAAAAGITVSWVYPDNPTVIINKNSIIIKAGINSSEQLQDVQLFINESQVMPDRGFAVAESDNSQNFDKYIDKELQLDPGLNTIKIVATDVKGQEKVFVRSVDVRLPQVVASTRTDRALIIGTDEYDEWNDLINPVFDATTIEEELRENYGFQTELILNPTKRDVLNKIREYAKKSYMPEDQLLIFIAGHGQFDEIFTEGYLVCKDSKKNDDTKESYISHSTMRTYVNNIPSNHTFIVMDVCFGGTFDQAIARAGSRGEDMYSDLAQEEFIKRKLRFKTRRYLTSGGKQYVPDGRPGNHSPFARKFLEALRNYGGRDKILTTGEMISYVETINPEPKYGEFGDNEPGSDFVFIAR
jgi:hypothetical protein